VAVSESEELLASTRRALLRRVAVGQAEGRAPSLTGAVVRDGGQAWWGSRRGTWTGLDGYYTGETLRLVPAAGDAAEYLDLGTFIFTREPYGPGSPVAARPHADGWRAG
jgi:hypothetical protein